MIFPDLPQKPMALQFEQTTFTALRPGLKLVVLGAVHGNEVAGSKAILRMIEEFKTGERVLQQGQVTFVPITNPLAYNREQRNGDRNLNRNLTPKNDPQDFEDMVAGWLCPVLAGHDVLLDLHTFHRGDKPFALFGPENNDGELQPFAQAELERSVARCLGVDRFVDGWLETYAKGVQARREYLARTGEPDDGLNTDERYGMGTTEYMRAHGGCSVTLECGQHDDPNGALVGYDAIDRTLRQLGLIDGEKPEPVKNAQRLTLQEVIDKQDAADRFSRDWLNFDVLKQGDLIGIRADGAEVRAPYDARIIFPNKNAQKGQEWFYLALESVF